MATPAPPSAPRSGGASKTPCFYFAQGKCRNGAACGFYHAPREDLAKSPLPCRFYLWNACAAGAYVWRSLSLSLCERLGLMYACVRTLWTGRACKFSHIIDAEQQASLMVVSASTGEKSVAPGAFRVPCNFFNSGACTAGDKCPYVHVAPKSSVSSSGSQRDAIKRPPSAVKRPVLNATNPQTDEAAVDEREEKPAALSEDAAEQHMSDFITKEEGTAVEWRCSVWRCCTRPGPGRLTRVVGPLSLTLSLAELFYYGAPGEFADNNVLAPSQQQQQHTGPSYSEVAKRNVPVALDDYFIEDFEEPAARPYVGVGRLVGSPPTLAASSRSCLLSLVLLLHRKTCTYFLQGLCRYGDSCFYLHALREDVETEDDMLEMGRELQASAELECNICYDNILQKEERFGLLSGCNHAFCLSCVRNWRGTGDQPKQTVRQCPVCRVETHFVIPSSRMVTDAGRKKVLVDTYRKNLAAIPCRHFNEGRGTCPFGTSCFYAHRFPDGSLDERVVRTAVDADGHYDVLRQARLAHFFQTDA